MNASRFFAFYDGMLVIIMTIIVLQFKIPEVVTWHSLFIKLPGFFCYAGSFFWLGHMWMSSYVAWQKVTKVCSRTLFYMLISLFFCSFFPFAIELVGEDAMAKPAQLFYGLLVLFTTMANLLLTNAIHKDIGYTGKNVLFAMTKSEFCIDFAIKILGFIGTLFIWTPSITIAMVISAAANTILLFRKPETAPRGRQD